MLKAKALQMLYLLTMMGNCLILYLLSFLRKLKEVLLLTTRVSILFYRCDALAGFISVIDAIPGDGMNAVWQEVQILFNTIPPRQFLSDNDVLAAASLNQITLVFTTEVYTCPVIGKKPKVNKKRLYYRCRD